MTAVEVAAMKVETMKMQNPEDANRNSVRKLNREHD
jgi:hypothetical protein